MKSNFPVIRVTIGSLVGLGGLYALSKLKDNSKKNREESAKDTKTVEIIENRDKIQETNINQTNINKEDQSLKEIAKVESNDKPDVIKETILVQNVPIKEKEIKINQHKYDKLFDEDHKLKRRFF